MLDDEDISAEDKFLMDEGFTAEDIAEMAESEREALLDDFGGDNDDDDPEGQDNDEDLDDKDDDDPDNADGGGDDSGDDAGIDDKEKNKDGDDADLDKDKDEGVQGKSVSKIESDDIAALNQSLAAKQTELSELTAKFKAGEIDIEDYMVEKDDLKDAITDIKVDIGKASTIQSVNEHNQASSWEDTQIAFFNREENKILRENEVMWDALQAQINKINDSKEGYKSFDDLLHRASEKVKAAFNVPAKPDEKNRGGKKKQNPPKPGDDDMPVNLHKVPAAAKSDTGGKFDHLEGLDGLELEAATAKMSPEMQDEWARSN